MSRAISPAIALAAAVALLGVSACKSVNEPAAQPSAAQPAQEAYVAPKAAEPVAPVPAEAAPAAAAKPAEASAPPAAAEPATDAKAAVPEAAPAPKAESPALAAPAATAQAPAAVPPVAKPKAPAAAVAKPALLTREQALALAGKGNCLACHKIESKVVGPAWKDVAAKYKGDANGAATIASHIKSGGSFGWKFGTMPPRGGSKMPDADVDALAKFIASLK